MLYQKDTWLQREKIFSTFAEGPLMDFWQMREECEFTGVDKVRICYVRFCSPHHHRMIVVCPGRIENYVKYAEIAWDLFHSGYDVFIIDHRGQGRSDRLLADSHRGHVVSFDDYVEDFDRFYQHEVLHGKWQHRYILAHSMGGAIAALWLEKNPDTFHAVALCAPMFGIALHWPEWMVRSLLDWAEEYPKIRDHYALGTGRWHPLPFALNVVTHSEPRYHHNVRCYTEDPCLRVGGPTFHWVREGILAGERALAKAFDMVIPTLLLQAEEDKVVDNQSHIHFCRIKASAGYPCEGDSPYILKGAFHEILFEKDEIRAEALEVILTFFNRYV